MLEQAKACSVLPLREAVAHSARRSAKSTDAEVGAMQNTDSGASKFLLCVHLGDLGKKAVFPTLHSSIPTLG
jgi:hypothetical protein